MQQENVDCTDRENVLYGKPLGVDMCDFESKKEEQH